MLVNFDMKKIYCKPLIRQISCLVVCSENRNYSRRRKCNKDSMVFFSGTRFGDDFITRQIACCKHLSINYNLFES